MVIEPLIGQHTAQKENSERSMSFDWALIFTEQFEAELVLLDQFWAEGYGADVHGQPHDVPQG
jgi:hypothetical protein